MLIVAKFSSVCPGCSGQIQVGEQVEWSKGQKARHAVCPAIKAATPPRRRTLCPNPRDCGDPGCTGDCGY